MARCDRDEGRWVNLLSRCCRYNVQFHIPLCRRVNLFIQRIAQTVAIESLAT